MLNHQTKGAEDLSLLLVLPSQSCSRCVLVIVRTKYYIEVPAVEVDKVGGCIVVRIACAVLIIPDCHADNGPRDRSLSIPTATASGRRIDLSTCSLVASEPCCSSHSKYEHAIINLVISISVWRRASENCVSPLFWLVPAFPAHRRRLLSSTSAMLSGTHGGKHVAALTRFNRVMAERDDNHALESIYGIIIIIQ